MIKIQDLVFCLVFLPLVQQGRFRLLASAGIICLFLAIPLFYFKILFTAERLTWYAAAFFAVAVFLEFWKNK